MKYERLTVIHPNGYISISETKQLPNTREANLVLNRLAELEDDLESGKMIRLPCKIGDTVFIMFKVNDNLYYGDYFVLDKIGFDKLGFYVETEKGIFRKDEIFLTKDEAVKKLKELQGE